MRTIRYWAAAVVLMFAGSAAHAVTLGIGDANYLGSVNDGIPSSPTLEASYINNLITLAAGAGDTVIGTETYNRQNSTLVGPFPTANIVGTIKDESEVDTITLSATFNYIIGKYDQSQAGSLVWYFSGGITGEITLPSTFNGQGISHISAYNLGGDCCERVPEPSSLVLFGGALIGAAILRRRRRIWG